MDVVKRSGDNMTGHLEFETASGEKVVRGKDGTVSLAGFSFSKEYLTFYDWKNNQLIMNYNMNTKELNVSSNTNLMKKTDYTAKDGRANLTLTANATAIDQVSFPNLATRRANTVTLNMAVTRNVDSTDSLVAVLPLDTRPVESYYKNVIADDNTPVYMRINTNGELHLYTAGKSVRISETYVAD